MLAEASVQSLAGVAIGIGLYVAVSNLIRGLLFQTSPIDPVIVIGAAAVMLICSLGAALFQVRRLARVSPALGLRVVTQG
jgi:hypothetical protein